MARAAIWRDRLAAQIPPGQFVTLWSHRGRAWDSGARNQLAGHFLMVIGAVLLVSGASF